MGMNICSVTLVGENGYTKQFKNLPCWSVLYLGPLNKTRFGGGFSEIYAGLPKPNPNHYSYLSFVFQNSVFARAFLETKIVNDELSMTMNPKLDTRFLINALVAARTPYESPEIIEAFNNQVNIEFSLKQTAQSKDQHSIVGKDGYLHALEYNSLC